MGDTIEFPFNNEMYFKQAKEHIEKEEFNQALEAIEKVYTNDKSPVVTNLYVSILYTLEEYEEALEIADKQKDFYMKNENYTISYVMLLIKNRLFIEAEAIIQNYLNDPTSPYHDVWNQINSDFHIEREQYILKIEQEKKETKQALMNLEMYAPFKQNEFIDSARDLELGDLQEAAPKILRNPSLGGMSQRAFLEVLVEKQDPNEYLFYWFGQHREIIPAELTVFEQDPGVNRIQEVLQEKLQKQPDLHEPVYTEVINDLLLLYPFIEETITDTAYWVDCYIAEIDFTNQLAINTEPKTAEQEELRNWFQKLNDFAPRNF